MTTIMYNSTALHEYGHADDIPADYSNKKRYKTLLAEKQANMTATRMMNDLFNHHKQTQKTIQ